MNDCFAKLLGLNEEEESPHNYQESERHPSNDRRPAIFPETTTSSRTEAKLKNAFW